MTMEMISCARLDVDRLRHVCTLFSAQPGTYNPITLSGGGIFKKKHAKLRTAKVIYDCFMRIFIAFRCGDAPPSSPTYFDSEIDTLVNKAWAEQRTIGWDQILKGRISKYWGQAQGLYYRNNPDTRGNVYFSTSLWSAATVRSMLDFILHLWNNRCNSMHGVDEEDAKRIIKNKITTKVVEFYGRRGEIETDYGYLFKESLDSLRKRSTQYLIKWVASFRIAENVLARGKLRGISSVSAPLRRGGRGKGKKSSTRAENLHMGEDDGGLEAQTRPVRAYSARHQHWFNKQVGRQVGRTTVVNESHTGDTGRPPDGNIGVHCTPTTT